MENSRKFSKPPSSLNFSRKPDNGSGSSGSTPSEDYKTPSLEHIPIPGFEFGPREGEPEPPTRLQQLMQNAENRQPSGGHTWTTGFRLEPANQNTDTFPRSLRSAGVSAPMKPVFGADDRISQLAGGYGSMVNGGTPKTGTTQVATSRHSNEANIVPLLRSPQTSTRQHKKTTFAALPNQTTWLQETTQRCSSLERDVRKPIEDGVASPSTELSGIRMKLEERRKQIESEKKRMEMQWTKQRQQVGKEAFIQVVTKNQHGSTSQTDLREPLANEKPSFYREMSDGSLMTHKQQERKNVLGGSSEGRIEGKTDLPPQQNKQERQESQKSRAAAEDGAAKATTQKTANIQGSVKQSQAKNTLRPAMQLDLLNANDVKQRTKMEAVDNVSEPMLSREGEPPGGDISEYSTSLDRLNCSLTELQGEIMRLSLQQDQIKSLVGTDLDPSIPTSKSYAATPVVTTQASKEQFYLFPRNMVVDSSASSATKRSVVSSAYGSTMSSIYGSAASSLYGSTGSSMSASSPGAKAYGTPMGVSGIAPHGNAYPSPMPPLYANLQGPYPHYFPPPPQATPYVGGHYSMPHTNPIAPPVSSYPGHLHYPDHGPVNYPPPGVGLYPGGWQAPVHSQMHGDTDRSQKPPASVSASSSGIQYHSDSSAFHPAAPPQGSSATPRTPQPVFTAPYSASTYSLHHSDPINYDPSPRSVLPSSSTSLPSPGSSATALSPSGSMPRSSDIPLIEDEAPVASNTAPSQAFFMVLDSDLPRRPKPVLGTNYRKKDADGSGAGRPNSTPIGHESSPSPVATVTTTEVAKPVKATVAMEMPASDDIPSVGFVIGEEENSLNELLQEEVEKKRQRLAELHQKRREELEMKKQKIEVEQQTKREALRVKQEKTDQKKADEKARREAIFQNYLQRKAEEDGSEDDVRPASHASSKRQNAAKPKTPRPKSQPPPATGGNLNEESRSYNTPGSVGSQLTDPRTASPGSDLSKSSERLNILTNFEQLEARLASLSQRTPSLSDRVPRFVSSSSDGGSDAGGVVGGNQLPDNYAGPKLFVKPSQKSNRHIIINAIKDCCLAGLVNQDSKNKVLEEINKSESKHFVILFRDAGMQYRGLYTYNPDREDVFKIHGVGPNRLLDKMMEKFYKYNSGAKNFSEVTSTKHLSATIDAVAILGSLWQKKPPTGAQAQGKRPV